MEGDKENKNRMMIGSKMEEVSTAYVWEAEKLLHMCSCLLQGRESGEKSEGKERKHAAKMKK
jgi:hypothetical protein